MYSVHYYYTMSDENLIFSLILSTYFFLNVLAFPQIEILFNVEKLLRKKCIAKMDFKINVN